MGFLQKIIDWLLKEDEVKPRPKIPQNVKVVDNGKLRPKTKYIIENQMPKALDDFNNRVDEWSKWIKTNLAPFYLVPLNPLFASIIANKFIYKLDKNELLAFRAAISKNPPFPLDYEYISKDIENALKQKGKKYVLRTGKR